MALYWGAAAQVSHIGVALSLATTDRASYAMLYRSKLARFLLDAARGRRAIDYISYLSETKGDIAKMTPIGSASHTDIPKQRHFPPLS